MEAFAEEVGVWGGCHAAGARGPVLRSHVSRPRASIYAYTNCYRERKILTFARLWVIWNLCSMFFWRSTQSWAPKRETWLAEAVRERMRRSADGAY
jgi:hypothetical protein